MTKQNRSYLWQYNNAFEIAKDFFSDKKDRGGNAYIGHILSVSDKVKHYGLDYRIVALLHDLLEDCPEHWTEEKLRELFSDEIVDAVVLLTKKENEPYDDYINNIMGNELARVVKLADLEDNMNITRLKKITEKDFERLKKYHNSYFKLKNNDNG